MHSRCLGIVCSSIVGQTSAHFGEIVGYAAPWTMLDAQVYLGKMGWSLGFAVDGMPREGEAIEIPSGMFSCSVGLVRGLNGGVCEIVRNGVRYRTPLIHAVMYRGGEWWDPQGDGSLKRMGMMPVDLYQVWPVYRVKGPEGGLWEGYGGM